MRKIFYKALKELEPIFLKVKMRNEAYLKSSKLSIDIYRNQPQFVIQKGKEATETPPVYYKSHYENSYKIILYSVAGIYKIGSYNCELSHSFPLKVL